MSRTVVDAARTGAQSQHVLGMVSEYRDWHREDVGGGVESRKANYAKLVNHYYDLATDFYEYGWGQSFHFAPREPGESLADSILRHELRLALGLGLRPGMHVLDVGCGVGGPARNIARFADVQVTGLNNNAYQVERASKLTREARLHNECVYLEGDFMDIPADAASFDAAYAIEATCHAPDRVGVYSEVYRVLRPGSIFAGYEWCLTDRYVDTDAEHREIKKGIEIGDGLPDLIHTTQVLEALKQAGFNEVSGRDLAGEGDPRKPWYYPLTGEELSLGGLPRTKPGRLFSHSFVWLMEHLRIAPRGATEVSEFLNLAADALVGGGRRGIFTPLFAFWAQKPGS